MPNATRENGTREQAATRNYDAEPDSEQPAHSALDRAQQDGFDILQRLKYATKHHEDAIIRVAEAEERVREAHNAYIEATPKECVQEAHMAVREAVRFLQEMQTELTIEEQRRDAAEETLAIIRAEREPGAAIYDTSRSGEEDGRAGSRNEGVSSTVLTSSEAERAWRQEEMTEWEWEDYERRRNRQYAYGSSFLSGTISFYEPAR